MDGCPLYGSTSQSQFGRRDGRGRGWQRLAVSWPIGSINAYVEVQQLREQQSPSAIRLAANLPDRFAGATLGDYRAAEIKLSRSRD